MDGRTADLLAHCATLQPDLDTRLGRRMIGQVELSTDVDDVLRAYLHFEVHSLFPSVERAVLFGREMDETPIDFLFLTIDGTLLNVECQAIDPRPGMSISRNASLDWLRMRLEASSAALRSEFDVEVDSAVLTNDPLARGRMPDGILQAHVPTEDLLAWQRGMRKRWKGFWESGGL